MIPSSIACFKLYSIAYILSFALNFANSFFVSSGSLSYVILQAQCNLYIWDILVTLNNVWDKLSVQFGQLRWEDLNILN